MLPEAHRAELRERIEREGSLRSIAESIIIYPTPHWTPVEYQIDLILRDEVAAADFEDAVLAIKRSFRGRTFGILGTHAQMTTDSAPGVRASGILPGHAVPIPS